MANRIISLRSVSLNKNIDTHIDNEVHLTNVKIFPFYATGDGVTDDTGAIQDAIDAANGNKIFLPPGNYLYTNLSVSSSVIFGGVGMSSKLTQAIYSGSGIILTGEGVSINFENIAFDGNRTNQSSDSTNAVIYSTVYGSSIVPSVISFTRCSFSNIARNAIYQKSNLDNATKEYVYVDKCQFYGINEGDSTTYNPAFILLVDGASAIITDNTFDFGNTASGYGASGILCAATQTTTPYWEEITVYGNKFNGLGRYASNSLGVIDFYIWGNRINISENTFTDSYSVPIKGKTNSKYVHICDNVINTVANSCNGIDVNASTTSEAYDDFIISRNIISDVYYGITVDSLSGDYLNNLIIEGNILDTIAYKGVYVTRTRNCRITDNILSSITSQGIWLTNCDGDFSINNNTIKTVDSFGIYADTGMSSVRMVCSNNNIEAATKYGIYFSGFSSVVEVGNNIDSITADSGISCGIYLASTSYANVNDNLVSNSTTGFSSSSITSLVEKNNSWNGKQMYNSTYPTSGTYVVGDIVWNNAPAASGYIGWVCTTAGTPGTWKRFGLISS